MCAIVSQPVSQQCLLTLYIFLLCAFYRCMCADIIIIRFSLHQHFSIWRFVYSVLRLAKLLLLLLLLLLLCCCCSRGRYAFLLSSFLCVYKSMPAFCNLHSIVLNVCASLPFDNEFLFIHRSRRRRRRFFYYGSVLFISCFVTTFRRYFDITVVSVVVSYG